MKNIPTFEDFVNEGNTRPLDDFSTNISTFKGAIAYSLKNHKKDGTDVNMGLGDKFGFLGKGGIISQRSIGTNVNTVWIGRENDKKAQEVADWLKSKGAKVVLFGPQVSGFSGSKQDFLDRYL
jgi:hypothetical protein